MGKYKNLPVDRTLFTPLCFVLSLKNRDFAAFSISQAGLQMKYLEMHSGAGARTYTLPELPPGAEEGVGNAADFPVHKRVLGPAVLENLVHVEGEELIGDAASV